MSWVWTRTSESSHLACWKHDLHLNMGQKLDGEIELTMVPLELS